MSAPRLLPLLLSVTPQPPLPRALRFLSLPPLLLRRRKLRRHRARHHRSCSTAAAVVGIPVGGGCAATHAAAAAVHPLQKQHRRLSLRPALAGCGRARGCGGAKAGRRDKQAAGCLQ